MTSTGILALSSTQRTWTIIGAGAAAALVVALFAWRVLREPNRSSWRVEVERRLLRTEGATQAVGDDVRGYLGRTSLGNWWTGRNEDLAHAVIDAYEREAVPSGDEARRTMASRLRVQIKRLYRGKDVARVEALALLTATPTKLELELAQDVAHEGWSRLRRAQRARRNRAILVSIGFAVAGLVVAWMLDRGVSSMTLLGSEKPTSNAFALLALGAVGGLVSLLGMVRRTPDITRSSGGWTAQAVLKVTSGGLLGLLGCWLLQSGVLLATEPLPPNQLALWAVLFGYSQDAVTKRFDERLATTEAPSTTTTDEDDPA